MDEQQEVAVQGYFKKTGRVYVPGELVELPIGALVFAEYQNVWATLDSFKEARCTWDEETNDWLVWLVTDFLLQPHIPPIYVDVLSDGVALVDGAHRVTSALIDGKDTIWAYLNQQ